MIFQPPRPTSVLSPTLAWSFSVSLVVVLVVTLASASADESLRGVACRSVHLWYDAPAGVAFYNEVTVERSAPGTYFAVCGWDTGYYGIQELGSGKKLLIFSVWDSKQDDPDAVGDEERARVLYKDEKVRARRFGGEGSGGQAFYDHDWKVGETYRFLVTARPAGARTEYSGYFFEPAERRWKRLITFSTITGGRPLRGYYSFVEDFKRDRVSATKVRRARYGNTWVRKTGGRWSLVTRARFTADRNPVTTIDAGVAKERFFLATGGDTKNTTTPLSKWVALPEKAASEPEDLPDLPGRDESMRSR